MGKTMKALPVALLCAAILAVPAAWAYWVQDGMPICSATGHQWAPTIASDGAGGAIIAWFDERSGGGSQDIYAQRVNASGAAQWTAGGVAICTSPYSQMYPVIVSDGAGGAIIAWTDYRSGGTSDIFAQRVNASGVVQWAANGIGVCTAANGQGSVVLLPDGFGGAFLVWGDYRNGASDIYAQRVNSSGAALWTANGVWLCAATQEQTYPAIAPDGAGGAIVAWQDMRNGSQFTIYAQRVNALGSAQWTANGVAICTAAGGQNLPQIVSDGAGGAIISWSDGRSGSSQDIYAQRVNASGVVQWTTNGVALCTATGNQYYTSLISDGASGAFVTWYDERAGFTVGDIYAQRVDASGAAQWTANGVGLCTATGSQNTPLIVSDGAGGGIVAWYDGRVAGNNDIYAQRVNASGTVQWAANGVALCAATGEQSIQTIVSDGGGGAIVTWQDGRGQLDYDIYAQVIDGSGRTGFLKPAIYAVRDVPGDQGGQVYLSWYGARSDAFMDGLTSYYSVWRAINPTMAALALEQGASSLDDLSALDLSSGKPVIRIDRAPGRTFFWELVHTVDALGMGAYGKTVATVFDSTSVCAEYHYFQVVAHTTDSRVYWRSDPDSGYSVDNLAPCAPCCLTAEQSFAPAGLTVAWGRNTAGDFGEYRLYRGTTEDFVPGSGNLIASACDTVYFDGEWIWSAGYYYKVSAVDVHGNESGFALLGPDDVTGNETPAAPERSFLSQNYPNPFNPTTKITFGLAAPANVSLRVYDAAGRLVRTIAAGTRPAGRYAETWDGRDMRGKQSASGVYFYRLDAGSFTETKKMILLR